MTCHYPESGHDWCAAIEDRSFWFEHRNRFLVQVMRQFPPETPLYDVGGGNGVVSAALREAGIRAIVVEPGEAGARRATERGLETIQATFEGARLPGPVPSVGLFDVLEHIESSVAFLSSVRGRMRPGGRIYIAVPAHKALWSAEDDYAQHFRRYTRGSLSGELVAAGFDVEHTTYMFALLPLPILLMRAIPYRFGFARTFTRDAVHADHAVGGVTRAVMDGLHAMERAALRTFGGLPFGASVVAVAKNPVGDR